MHQLRTHHKAISVLLLLLVLSLQVQSTFACEVMDHSGTLEQCCCGESKADPCVAGDDDARCCEYEQQITVKNSDPEQDNAEFTPAKPFELKPPLLLALITLVLDAEPRSSTNTLTLRETPPGSIGKLLYLTTQRLRI